ncbi:MAG: UPF0175 family protein [Thermotogota bacterium]|nr:UPF0175 family protein [Thermotogota bacterium]
MNKKINKEALNENNRFNSKVPEEILYTLNETKSNFIKKMKFYTAIELYKMHKLSMGKAAELAEMNKTDFMFELNKYEIPAIDYEKLIIVSDSSQIANRLAVESYLVVSGLENPSQSF